MNTGFNFKKETIIGDTPYTAHIMHVYFSSDVQQTATEQ